MASNVTPSIQGSHRSWWPAHMLRVAFPACRRARTGPRIAIPVRPSPSRISVVSGLAVRISPLPPMRQSRYRQQGRFPPALPGFPGTTSGLTDFPGLPVIRPTFAPPISQRGEEGFSSCLARPRHVRRSAVAPQPVTPCCFRPRLEDSASGVFRGHLCGSLSLRSGNSPTTPYGRVNGLQFIGFPPPCHPNYRARLLPRRVYPPLNAPAFATQSP